jgi:hypothetical protein
VQLSSQTGDQKESPVEGFDGPHQQQQQIGIPHQDGVWPGLCVAYQSGADLQLHDPGVRERARGVHEFLGNRGPDSRTSSVTIREFGSRPI